MQPHALLIVAASLDDSGLPPHLTRTAADVSHFVRANFSIDDARKLVNESIQSGFAGERAFVLFAEKMTVEAQNALLKLFEDPPPRVIFYLVVPDDSILLPTLRSRLIGHGQAGSRKISDGVRKFQRSSHAERLAYIAKLAEDEPEALERLATELGQLDINDQEFKRSLSLVIGFIRNRGASRKILTEELALTLPIEK